MTIFTTIPNEKKEEEKGPEAQLLVSSKDVEAGTVDPVTVRTLNASRQQVLSMLERRRRRLRCVLILTSLMTIGTAALAVFYLAQFLYTYSRALHYQGMCQYSFEEPPESQNEAGRLYGRRNEAQVALAGAGRQPIDVELHAGPRQYPPVGSNSRLIGRPDGHESGYLVPHLNSGEESDEYDEYSENGDVEKKHHHKKKTTTKKPSAAHEHGGRQVVQERVDIDQTHVRLEVPQLETLKSSSVLHDFNTQWTAFLDADGLRCFVKPLAKTMVSPPRSLVDLLVKLETNYYAPNVQAIRVQYRILSKRKTRQEMARYGPFIRSACDGVPTYEMIPIISNANSRRRRAVDSKHMELNFGLAGGEGAPIVEIADIQFN